MGEQSNAPLYPLSGWSAMCEYQSRQNMVHQVDLSLRVRFRAKSEMQSLSMYVCKYVIEVRQLAY